LWHGFHLVMMLNTTEDSEGVPAARAGGTRQAYGKLPSGRDTQVQFCPVGEQRQSRFRWHQADLSGMFL
jgi:hypothetical protein